MSCYRASILNRAYIIPKEAKIRSWDGGEANILKYYNNLWPSKGPQHINRSVVLNLHGVLHRKNVSDSTLDGWDGDEKNVEKYWCKGKSSGICQLPNLVKIL